MKIETNISGKNWWFVKISHELSHDCLARDEKQIKSSWQSKIQEVCALETTIASIVLRSEYNGSQKAKACFLQ